MFFPSSPSLFLCRCGGKWGVIQGGGACGWVQGEGRGRSLVEELAHDAREFLLGKGDLGDGGEVVVLVDF